MTALYLHETIDIVGQGAWPYMAHTLQASGNETNQFVLQGTWYVMGITGRWPQVINIWDVPGGWQGWTDSVDRLNLKRQQNTDLGQWWDEAYKSRTGGFDRLLAGAPQSPTTDTLVSAGVRGTLFVHEIATVRSGTAPAHLDAVANTQVPLMAEYGFVATGLYETLMTDTEVITVWAGSVQSHTDLLRAEYGARHGPAGGDPRLAAWRRESREYVASWRSELMTPYPGIPIGPSDQQESGSPSGHDS
ncbi:unannotated protein [freshwater metagenome]|uniref:Unannotated protein n=1 Tax=freshwater metagenome TaxID=449393 RepID=A0A6J7EU71_9ZZZZ|nr:hypothetical protein [Actinomycetota bacterium]